MELNITIIKVIKDFGTNLVETQGDWFPSAVFFFFMFVFAMILLCIRIEQCKRQKITILNLTEVLDMYMKQKEDGEEDETSKEM